VDKELVGRSQPEGVGQWLDVQMDDSDNILQDILQYWDQCCLTFSSMT